MAIYDPKREAELVATVAETETAENELREAMQAMQDGTPDDGWSESKAALYMVKNADLRNLTDKRGRAETALANLRMIKPVETKPYEGSETDMIERVLRKGRAGLSEDEIKSMEEKIEALDLADNDPKPGETGGIVFESGMSIEQARRQRAIGIGHNGGPRLAAVTSDTNSGSNFIDTDTLPQVVDTLAQFGGALRVCGRLSSSRSGPIRIPQEDASSQKGVMVATQGTAATESQTPNPGFVTFDNYTFNSGWVEITNEMISDSGFDIVGWVLLQLQRRIGRIMNEKFTKGTGTNEPAGFLSAAMEFGAAGASAIVFPDELLDLEYEVDEAFLDGFEKGPGGLSGVGMGNRDGMIGFTFNRKTEGYLRKAKDSDGRPLWQPGITAGVPSMINGWPYETNNDIDTIATGKKTVVFGNLGNHKIRLTNSIALYNFWDSGTAMRNSRRVVGFARADADNIVAKNSASKWPGHVALVQA